MRRQFAEASGFGRQAREDVLLVGVDIVLIAPAARMRIVTAAARFPARRLPVAADSNQAYLVLHLVVVDRKCANSEMAMAVAVPSCARCRCALSQACRALAAGRPCC
jgi:hypothetical protein